DVSWFFDDTIEEEKIEVAAPSSVVDAIPFEPKFLFSDAQLQAAIPELLSQTGTTGRQFAHLLIRAQQEAHQNRFPDLERAAEGVGGKRFPPGVEALMAMTRRLGLRVRWFDHPPFREKGADDPP